ncbi:MAG: HPP family protein [Sulfuritalea sp.]
MNSRDMATQSPWQKMLGIELSPVSHRERLVSGFGGFVGIVAVYFASHALGGPPSAPLLIFSIGASTVLVFAVPHGALSQPWPVFGGHLVSALIGVACARMVPDAAFAAAAAVGLSIAAMHYLRCIHPPGGATALVAVLGGAPVQALGFGFVLSPVMVNVAILLVAAVAFNAFFPWRRYPVFLARRTVKAEAAGAGYEAISHEDFVFALTQMDSFIDISEEDLLRIYGLATGRHREVEAQAAARTINSVARP